MPPTEDQVGKLKARLAAILDQDPDDLRLFPFLTEEEKVALHEAQMEEKRLRLEEAARRRRALRAEKNKNKKVASSKRNQPVDEAQLRVELRPEDIEPLVIHPLPEDKSLDALHIPADAVVFFVYRIDKDSPDFEPINVPGFQLAPPPELSPEDEAAAAAVAAAVRDADGIAAGPGGAAGAAAAGGDDQ
jgi:hypothetical protein